MKTNPNGVVTKPIRLASGIDATKKLSGEGFKRPWPAPVTKYSEKAMKVGFAHISSNPFTI